MWLLQRPWQSGAIVEPVVPTRERHRILGPQAVDDLQLLLEQLHARAERREVEAVRRVLSLVPPCAEPELEAAARHVVDRRRRLREHRGVAEGDRRDERAEPDPLGPRGQSGQCRDGVERRSFAPPDDREVVIRAEQPLEPAALADVRKRQPLVPGDALLSFHHQAEPHRSAHHDATIALVRLAALAIAGARARRLRR